MEEDEWYDWTTGKRGVCPPEGVIVTSGGATIRVDQPAWKRALLNVMFCHPRFRDVYFHPAHAMDALADPDRYGLSQSDLSFISTAAANAPFDVNLPPPLPKAPPPGVMGLSDLLVAMFSTSELSRFATLHIGMPGVVAERGSLMDAAHSLATALERHGRVGEVQVWRALILARPRRKHEILTTAELACGVDRQSILDGFSPDGS